MPVARIPMLVRCPECKTTYDLDEDRAGRRVSCQCGVVFRIPKVSSNPEPVVLPPAPASAPSAAALNNLFNEEKELLDTPQVIPKSQSPLSAYDVKTPDNLPPTPVTVNVPSINDIRTDFLPDAIVEASLGLIVSAVMLLIHAGIFLASANVIPEANFSDRVPFVVLGFVFVGIAVGNLVFGVLLRCRVNVVRPLGLLTGLASIILFFGLLALTVIGTVMQLAEGERGFIISGLVGLVFQVLGFAFSIKAVRWMFSDPANRFFRELAGR